MAKLLLVVSLALMLPFESALCAPAGIAGRTGSCAMRACCRSHAACAMSRARHAGSARGCSCRIVPAGAQPAAAARSLPATSFVLSALALERPAALAAARTSRITPPPDVGSPPLPAALGAHLLRAPPLPA